MAKAKGTFHLYDPEVGRTVQINEGDTIPDHLIDKVGPHLGGTAGEGRPSTDPGTPAPAAGSEEYDNAVAASYEKGRADAVAAEAAVYDAEGYGEFDPSAEGVKADAVKDYLQALDRDTVAGQREFGRVTEAEKAGANRSTALID